jgi:hypothetical protein
MKVTFAELNRGKSVIRRVTLSANIDAQLVAYAKYLGAENGQDIAPEELIEPMLARFMAGDRMFKQAQRNRRSARDGETWPGRATSRANGLLSQDGVIDLTGLNEEWRPGTCELSACWQALQRLPQA